MASLTTTFIQWAISGLTALALFFYLKKKFMKKGKEVYEKEMDKKKIRVQQKMLDKSLHAPQSKRDLLKRLRNKTF